MTTSITLDQLKQLALASADVREQSYDRTTNRYQLSTIDAVVVACGLLKMDIGFAMPIYLAIQIGRNDLLDWAGDHKGRESFRLPVDFKYPTEDVRKRIDAPRSKVRKT